MLKIKIKYFIAVLLISPFLLITINAQPEDVIQRRQVEHQAVKDFLNIKLLNAPKNSNSNTSTLKYSLLNYLHKTKGEDDRKSFFMNGNNVAVEIENYGGIAPGYGSIRNITNLIWRDAPYIFQFCPIVGASVLDTAGERVHIITDGMNDWDYEGLREIDPGTGLKWQWQPLPGYADPNQPYIASNPTFDTDRDGKPDSWPRDWYNETLGEYVWPGYLVQGENNADLEAFFAMDDRDNKEFGYYPYTNDHSKQGLGVQVDGRAFQWSNALAANTIFFVWSITNVSDTPLDTVVFGIYGDPDIGYDGLGGNEPADDNGLFISPYDSVINGQNIPLYARNMVYFFDGDGIGDNGKVLGYLGCKFLESPGNPNDGIDNDGDGFIDERQDNAIDEDGDWDFEIDDVGKDGIAGTADEGEGDGIPTLGNRLADGRPDPLQPGEPNFGYTDLDESDQVGLTSFHSTKWRDTRIAEDENIWNATEPGKFTEITNNEDIVFIFGSGYISLAPGETKRISMAFLFGEDRDDLLITAETVQNIYNKNYKFFRPPDLPKVSAVPDDKKVTLYWDSNAENSIDPITGKDFEGYAIYRSTRPDFADQQNITDGKGSKYLYEPLKDINGSEAKWDLINDWRGFHPVPYNGRGISYYLGDNSGLVHTFVDSNQVRNGQTYYYAVVAYDHGDSVDYPVSETTKKVSLDPITNQVTLSNNTVSVIPGPRASGYETPKINSTDILHLNGSGNGTLNFVILSDTELKDELYTITFKDTVFLQDTTFIGKNYSVIGEKAYSESFYLYGTKFSSLSKGNIINDALLQVKDAIGNIYQLDVDFELNFEKGTIKRTANSSMLEGTEYYITFKSYAIFQSTALDDEDFNPVFDGILLKVKDNPIFQLDNAKTKWSNSNIYVPYTIDLASIGAASRKKLYPGDYILTFVDEEIYTAKKIVSGQMIEIPVNYKVDEISTGVDIPIVTLLNEKAKNDSAYTRGDEIIFFQPGAVGILTDTLTWGVTLAKVSQTDSLIPGSGYNLLIYTKRPFKNSDIFTLQTKAGFIDTRLASSSLDNIYVVPNPYVGANEIEPANKLSGQNRGERRIYFENLPMKCSIRIFTLSGELVTTLEHDSGAENGREFWNLLNNDGFSVAYGVYLAHIDAPGVGEKLIKFALIK
ncbi:MAG: hypothetical protein IPJ23_06760 [Ignavibacteriales bacterium]|nr:hypothetical protein [Ignavibacteriales bacterium]